MFHLMTMYNVMMSHLMRLYNVLVSYRNDNVQLTDNVLCTDFSPCNVQRTDVLLNVRSTYRIEEIFKPIQMVSIRNRGIGMPKN